jgi:putative transcriptional regulator
VTGQPGIPDDAAANDGAKHAIDVHLDRLLAERQLTLTELAERVGVTLVNLSVLKNGRAKAIRFSTLTAICRELDCQPGDLLAYRDSAAVSPLESPR